MDSKPGKAFIEFLDLPSARSAYDEISQENNDFKLKLITNDKIKEKRNIQIIQTDTDSILKQAGAVLEKRDTEFEQLESLEIMEEVLMKRIETNST